MAVQPIGEELGRRGGMEVMRNVSRALGDPRPLDMMWSGIEEWLG